VLANLEIDPAVLIAVQQTIAREKTRLRVKLRRGKREMTLK
jgi:hypothetical protein